VVDSSVFAKSNMGRREYRVVFVKITSAHEYYEADTIQNPIQLYRCKATSITICHLDASISGILILTEYMDQVQIPSSKSNVPKTETEQ
jgi:hypothetical protein